MDDKSANRQNATMETARTIAEAKAAFLRNQIQILTAPISPQEGWRNYAPETEDDISDKVVEEVLQKGTTRRLEAMWYTF